MRPGWPHVAVLATLALLGTVAVYGRTTSYGFSYDDYHFVRPHSAADVIHAWSGSWDATGIETRFYRPLTTAFMALRFEVLGINAPAYRWLTLGMFAAAAALCGVWVSAVTGSAWAAMLTAAWFCAYPTFAYSLAGWVMHQMHLLEVILVLAALLWWWHCKSKAIGWWFPLLALQVAVMLVKEDGIMLTPAILATHTLYRALVDRTVPRLPGVFVVMSAAACAGFFVIRWAFLEGIGGYRVPAWTAMWQNLVMGPERVFLQAPARRPWQPFVSLTVRLLPIAAAWPLVRASNRRFAFLGASGVVIALLFNLPFAFVSKAEQYHLVGLGACLLLIASAGALAGVFPGARLRACVWVLAFLLTGPFAKVTVQAVQDFSPCSPRTLSTNAIVRGWAVVPAEIRNVLPTTEASCDARTANPADLPVVVFGAWDTEYENGVPVRWTTGHVTILARPAPAPLLIPIHAMLGPPSGDTAKVVARAGGQKVVDMVLHDGRWRCPRVPLDARAVSWLRRSAVVQLEVFPTWVPAEAFPGSLDRRELGVRLGPVGSFCPG